MRAALRRGRGTGGWLGRSVTVPTPFLAQWYKRAVGPRADPELLSAALAGPLAPYAVELLLPERVNLDVAIVLQALGGVSGEVEFAALPQGGFSLIYPDHRTDFKDALRVPMRHLVTFLDGTAGAERAARLEDALQQTWDWSGDSLRDGDVRAGARTAVARSRASLLVSDVPGLRDLQVRFRDHDTGLVAGWLFAAARFVFERGDFMAHGDTVDGIGGVWRCHHEVSGVGPARHVVDLRPRDEFRVAPVAKGIRCPACAWVPDTLSRWECDCGFTWNTFDTRGQCPACAREHLRTACLRCHKSPAHERWYK